MFKLSDVTDTYPWTITVKLPDNGSYRKMPVKVIFNRLPHDERVELLEQINTANHSDINDVENDFFNKVFAGWEKGQIKDENGNDLEVNEDSKRQLLTISEFRYAVVDGYFDSVGGNKVKTKTNHARSAFGLSRASLSSPPSQPTSH